MRYRWAVPLALLAVFGIRRPAAFAADGTELLPAAPLYLYVQPERAQRTIKWVLDKLPGPFGRFALLFRTGLERGLGFDPLSPSGLRALGIAPGKRITAALASGSIAQLDRALAAARKRPDKGPPLLFVHRVVVPLADAKRFRDKLTGLPALSRNIALLGRDDAAGRRRLERVLRLRGKKARAVAKALRARQVIALLRVDRAALLTLRVRGGVGVLDLVHDLLGRPLRMDRSSTRQIARALRWPKHPQLEPGDPLLKRVWGASSTAGGLLEARRSMAFARRLEKLEELRRLRWARESPAKQARRMAKRRRRCARALAASGSTSDLAFSVGYVGKHQLQLQAWWRSLPGVTKALSAHQTSRDLIDLSRVRKKATGVAVARLALGGASRALAKGIYARDDRGLNRCAGAPLTAHVLLGNWPRLAGLLRSEIRRDKHLRPLVRSVRDAAVVFRKLPGDRRTPPSAGLVVRIAKNRASAVERLLGRLLRGGTVKRMKVRGLAVKVTEHPHIAPLRRGALGVAHTKGGELQLSLSALSRDVGWLLGRTQPHKPTDKALVRGYATAAMARWLALYTYGEERRFLQMLGRLARDGTAELSLGSGGRFGVVAKIHLR